MKLLVIGDAKRTEKYLPDLSIVSETQLVVAQRGTSDDAILELAADADAIMADAISPVSRYLMERMPNLKLVHSEGVAYNAIDCAAATELGVTVCNNRGVNAVGVAEQTLLLMLGLCKSVVPGDRAVRSGDQIRMKEQLMVSGISEIAGSVVGLVVFGDIAREVAVRCRAFGATVYYNKRTPLPSVEEERYGATFLPLDDLLATSDFVSLHVPVTPETEGMVDDAFFAKMKDGGYLVNTARGEIVDNGACVRALESGRLAGAGFDTVAPEPVQADNELVKVPQELRDRVLFSPHIGGVTTNMFGRAHRNVWENFARVMRGEQPTNIVNG